jgi:O-antigen/teichoic acid export membrane protein
MGVSVISVQGTAYLSQLIIAKYLSPSQFGIVRSIETIIVVLFLIGSLGMPTLAIKEVARAESDSEKILLLLKLLVIVLICSGSIALIIYFILKISESSEIKLVLQSLIWLILLIGLSRTCLNYFQGIKQIKKMSAINTFVSFSSLMIMIFAVKLFGINGWIFSRYLGELILFFAAVIVLFKNESIDWNGKRFLTPFKKLIIEGVGLSSSLLIRTCIDSLPILLLGYFQFSYEKIGYFGFSTLILNSMMIVPGIIANLAIPKFIEIVNDKVSSYGLYKRLIKVSLSISIVLMVVIITFATGIVYNYLDKYRAAIALTIILAISLPFRAVSSISGSVVISHGISSIAVKVNFASLITLGLLESCFLIYRGGLVQVAWAFVATEIFTMVLFLALVKYKLWRTI